MNHRGIIQIFAIALTVALGVSTDFLARIYPPDGFGVAMAADEPKHIDFTQTFTDDDGLPVISDFACPFPVDKDGKKIGPRPCKTLLTFGELVFRALRTPSRAPFEELVERDDLAAGVRTATAWPILPKQRDLIKKALAEAFPWPMMIGPAAKMLEGK